MGGQPILETDRITDTTERHIEVGNKGEDDAVIQLYKIKAEEGDVPSMVTVADWYYYGSHG